MLCEACCGSIFLQILADETGGPKTSRSVLVVRLELETNR